MDKVHGERHWRSSTSSKGTGTSEHTAIINIGWWQCRDNACIARVSEAVPKKISKKKGPAESQASCQKALSVLDPELHACLLARAMKEKEVEPGTPSLSVVPAPLLAALDTEVGAFALEGPAWHLYEWEGRSGDLRA